MSACCSCTTGQIKNFIYEIITKQIDANASDGDDFEYKFCVSCYNAPRYGSTLLGAAVKGYVHTDKNLCLSLREINTSTNETIKEYSANDPIVWTVNNRQFEIIVESITMKMSVSPSIAPYNQSDLNIIKDYCISPKKTPTIGQLKQELANRYGYRLIKLYLTDSSRSRRQLLDDMSIENAWFFDNIANSLINVVANTMSCCDNCLKDVNRQYYCRIDIKQVDPNNNNNSDDTDFKYLFCRHTGPVRVKDIYYVCVDGYNETDISLEIRNTNQSNDTNQWLNCDQFIDFADYIDYTVEQKRTGSIRFEIRAIQVTVNMSLAGLKQTQKPEANNQQSLVIPLNILPIQTATVGQLKQQLALKYMFETETVSLYLSDMDTNEPQDNRQLTDDQPIAYVWFYGYYSRSVINIVSIKSVKYLTEVINRSNDLILEKMTTLLSMANSGQSVSNQSADVITDAVITANNDLLSAKMTELTTTLSDTIRDCFTEQTKAITDAIISANKYNNNDVLTTGKLMTGLANHTKHIINALAVRDKYLADILVDESETNSQWTCNESIVRIDDDINIIDDNQSIDKTIISQTVSESMDNNNTNNNDTTGVGINDNNIDISNTDSLNQIGSELVTINNDDDDNDDSQLADHLLDTEAVVVVADQQQHRDSDRLQELMNAMAEIQMQITILDKKSKNN